jgi:hypothetical protein
MQEQGPETGHVMRWLFLDGTRGQTGVEKYASIVTVQPCHAVDKSVE